MGAGMLPPPPPPLPTRTLTFLTCEIVFLAFAFFDFSALDFFLGGMVFY